MATCVDIMTIILTTVGRYEKYTSRFWHMRRARYFRQRLQMLRGWDGLLVSVHVIVLEL